MGLSRWIVLLALAAYITATKAAFSLSSQTCSTKQCSRYTGKIENIIKHGRSKCTNTTCPDLAAYNGALTPPAPTPCPPPCEKEWDGQGPTCVDALQATNWGDVGNGLTGCANFVLGYGTWEACQACCADFPTNVQFFIRKHTDYGPELVECCW